MKEDSELLRLYVEEGNQAAFAELVQRHLGLVYNVALRKLGGDTHAAQDVAQRVFADLVRKGPALSRHPVLTGWLFTSAQYAATQVVRAEQRRRAREGKAAMNEMNAGDAAPVIDWERLRPLLDDLIGELEERDRHAVILRFFEGKSLADVGARLGLSEDGARSRVGRALDRLYAGLARRGVTSTAAALGAALASPAGATVPAGLAATVAGSALAGGSAAGAGWIGILNMTKLQMGIATTLIVAGGAGLAVQARSNADLEREIAALRVEQRPLATLREENQRLLAASAEVARLRQDDIELKRLEQKAVEIRQARAEQARLAQLNAQNRVRTRINELQEKLREMQRLAQEEVDRLNEEGNALVGAYKELLARAKDATVSTAEQEKASATAAAKLEEIKAKQAEIKTFTENTRRALVQSPLTAELHALGVTGPLPPDPAAQRQAGERNAAERRGTRERANAPTAPVQP